MALLDQVVFEKSFERAFQNPIKALGKITTRIMSNTGKFLQKNITRPFQSIVQSLRNRVSRSFVKGKKVLQKKIVKPLVSAVKKGMKVTRQRTAQLAKTML